MDDFTSIIRKYPIKRKTQTLELIEYSAPYQTFNFTYPDERKSIDAHQLSHKYIDSVLEEFYGYKAFKYRNRISMNREPCILAEGILKHFNFPIKDISIVVSIQHYFSGKNNLYTVNHNRNMIEIPGIYMAFNDIDEKSCNVSIFTEDQAHELAHMIRNRKLPEGDLAFEEGKLLIWTPELLSRKRAIPGHRRISF